MIIASSAKISEKHTHFLREKFPTLTFRFFASIDEVIHQAKEAEILITNGNEVTADVLAKLPNLKWIQALFAGFDQMPLQVLKERGILLTNARGIHGIQMAEYTLGVMLHHTRALGHFFKNQEQRVWDRRIRVDELYEKTLGVVGTGAIGSAIAERARAFGMKVYGLSRRGNAHPAFEQVYTRDELPLLLRQSDFVVVITPLTPETEGMIGEEELKMMKKEAVFIDIARGRIVDENALLRALREGWIAAAYLDVFSEEPLPQDHPLWNAPNCWITPHVAGLTPRYMERALNIFTHNLPLYLDGQFEKMANLIDLDQGY